LQGLDDINPSCGYAMFFRAGTRRLPGWRCVAGGEEAGTSDPWSARGATDGLEFGKPGPESLLARETANYCVNSTTCIFLEVFATPPVDLFWGSDL
jgi:hypothetical protein